MSAKRLQSIEQGLTSIARKVLEAVPISEAWPVHKINDEVHRLGHSVSLKVLHGCLSSLCESGLVREYMRGQYARIKFNEKPEPLRLIKETVMPAPETTPKKDVLSVAADLSSRLRQIANEVDDFVLTIKTEKTETDDEIKKLRALRDMLKGL